MQGELETKESLKRTLQMMVFNNNQYDLEELQRMLLDGARYVEFMQQLKEEDTETFIDLKKQWWGDDWKECFKERL